MAAKKQTGAKRTSRASTRTTKTKKFVRNATGYGYRNRLERQQDQKNALTLEPRGRRGDLAPLQPGDLEDPGLAADIAQGLLEVITEGEAKEILSKQTTNQQAVHPALASLRNEKGEEYPEDALKVVESYEDQGTTVAELEDGQIVIDRGTGAIRRTRPPGAAPGTPAGIPGADYGGADVPADEAADAAARQKNAEGPGAGLGGIKRVVVNPTQKT